MYLLHCPNFSKKRLTFFNKLQTFQWWFQHFKNAALCWSLIWWYKICFCFNSFNWILSMCNSSLVFVKKLCVHIFCLVFFFFSILTIVVIYAATWVNFEPKLRKKIHPEKKFLYFNGTFVPAFPPPRPPPKKKKLIKLPCSFRRNWILEQPLLFSGYSSIRFFKVIFCDFRDSHHSHLIFCDFWDTMLEVFTFIPYNLMT